jgi:hypothetical protein
MHAINRPHIAVTHRGRLGGVELVVAEALDEGGAPREASAEEAEHRCGKRAMGMSLEHHHDVIRRSSGGHQEVIRRSSGGHQEVISRLSAGHQGDFHLARRQTLEGPRSGT